MRSLIFVAMLAALAVALLLPTGCMVFDPAGQIGELLKEPAVQATLQDWSAKGSAHNPRIGGQMVTGFEIFTIGVDVEGDISGAAGTPAKGGIDPELLKCLTEIALQHGYSPPAKSEPPSVIPSP